MFGWNRLIYWLVLKIKLKISMLKKMWYKIALEEGELIKIKLSDIRFGAFKKSALVFNKNFPNNLTWTPSQIKLREEISKRKYKSNNDYPKISADGVCLDGYHRLCSLIKYYGEDYVVEVKKSRYVYNRLFWIALLSFPIIKIFYRKDKVLN